MRLEIALRSWPISLESIRRLFNSGQGGNSHDREGIPRGLPGKAELLLRVERERVAVVAHVEIWKYTEDALLLLFLNLYIRNLGLGERTVFYMDCGHGRRYRQDDRRD